MAQILLLANNKLVLASCCWFTVKWQMLLGETLLPRVPRFGAKTKKGLVEQAEHWKGSGAGWLCDSRCVSCGSWLGALSLSVIRAALRTG